MKKTSSAAVEDRQASTISERTGDEDNITVADIMEDGNIRTLISICNHVKPHDEENGSLRHSDPASVQNCIKAAMEHARYAEL